MIGATAAPAEAAGFYGSFSAGYNSTDDIKAVNAPTTIVDMSAHGGFTIGVALGYHLDEVAQGLRIEGEISYHKNNVLGTISTPGSTGNQADLAKWLVMANVWYDFDMGSRFKPYVGGGIGYARNTFRPLFALVPSVTQEGFAWQAGLGVNYALSPHSALGLGYRYVDAGDLATLGAVELGSAKDQSVSLSVSFDLN